MKFNRSGSVICVVVSLLSLNVSCSAAPGPQSAEHMPVATNEDGQPIFLLSEDELIHVFRGVEVHYNVEPAVAEVFREGGRYSTASTSVAGVFLEEGRFWVEDGELCTSVDGQTVEPLCRRFGRDRDGAVYEIAGSRGAAIVPYRYEFRPVQEGRPQ
jgi:hypothetical protein